MLDIYICEDNPRQLAFIKEKIENFIAFEELDMQIVACTPHPDEIIEKAQQSHNSGLYFLDIDLKDDKTNGFVLAQSIRRIEPRCFIVFVTSHIELSYMTYQYKVEALDFIVKDRPDTVKNKIHECMLNAYEKHVGGQNTNKNIFEITSPGRKSIAVYYNDILCFETSAVTHRVCLRGKNRVIEFPQQLSNIEESLGSDFFRCHRSVIVNLRNISQVDYKTCVITLSDGTTCPLSTRKKAALQKKLKHL